MRKILSFGLIFKRSSNLLAGLCVIGLLCSSASADAIVNFDAANGGPLDQAGVGGTMFDSTTGSTVQLTTIDIVGYDGTSFVSSTPAATHTTNIQATGPAFGVNSDSTPPGAGSDSRDFDNGEQWIFSFDQDIELVEIDLAGQGAGETFQVSSPAFATMALPDGLSGDVHSFANLAVPAGTTITFEAIAGTGIRVSEFTVNVVMPVPEPSSFALLGLTSLGMITRRRRR